MLTPLFWNYYSSFACCFDWKKSACVCVWERVRLCVKPHLHVHIVAVFSQLLVLSVVWPRDGVCTKVNQPIVAGKEWCDICLSLNSLIKCHVKICYEVRPTVRLTESVLGQVISSLLWLTNHFALWLTLFLSPLFCWWSECWADSYSR